MENENIEELENYDSQIKETPEIDLDLHFENKDKVIDLIQAITNEDSEIYNKTVLKDLLFNINTDILNEVIDSVYAIDIALTMEDFSNYELTEFYKKINDQHMAQILEQASDKLQYNIVNALTRQQVLSIFQHMSKDDITDILGKLRTDIRKEFLNLMRVDENKLLQNLLLYREDTVGGIMTTEYISLKESMKVSDALIKIKEIAPKTEVIETIFVVNSRKELVGTADLRDIFVAEDDKTLYDIMHDSIITVTPEVDQEEVSKLVSKYDLKAIAVINKRGAMLGIVTVDDIIDVLVEEHTEDILKFGGVSGEEGINTSIGSSVKIRLPWLLLNLVTAFLAAFVVDRFEGVIAEVVALSAMMPVVAGMSGNSGSQTLVIVIRGITLGEINLKNDWKRVFKELSVGIINAIITGSVAAIVIFVMYDNIVLSMIIIAVMVLNSIVSSTFGFFIPLTLKAIGVDPALASNIFLTTATDTMAFMILLGLASVFLPYIV